MSTWESKIGKFSQLTQKAVYDKIGTAAYLFILARRSGKHAELVDNDADYETCDTTDPKSLPRDPYFRFETFDQVLAPKKKPVKKGGKKKKDDDDEEEAEVVDEDAEPTYYTYDHAEFKPQKDPKDKKKTKKDADGNVVYDIDTAPQKVKKFATVGIDLKKWLTYLFNKFMKEVLDCFEKNGKKFTKDPSEVLNQVCTWVAKNCGSEGIAPFIVAVGGLIPVNNYIDDGALKGSELHFDLTDYLLERAQKSFKGEKNQSPNAHLSVIIDAYVTFLKVVSILYMESIWGKSPGAMHIASFEGIIRQLYILLSADEKGGHTFQYEIYSAANDWVTETEASAKKERESKTGGTGRGKKPKKAEKTDDDADGDDAVDDEVDELAGNEDDAGEAEEVNVDD
jgi:hypothetical protein